MIVYDLFSGTGSATKGFRDRGHKVYTFDNDTKFDATEHVDVLTLTAQYLKDTYGKPDFLWASPPCTAYSVGSFRHHWEARGICKDCGGEVVRVPGERWEPRTCRPTKNLTYIPKSDTARLARETLFHLLDLIYELKPHWWIIENPRALMRKMPPLIATECARQTITHCQYGDPRRMKPTDLFGVFPRGFEARSCKNGDPCHEAASRGARTGTQGLSSTEGAMLPPQLSVELCRACEQEE